MKREFVVSRVGWWHRHICRSTTHWRLLWHILSDAKVDWLYGRYSVEPRAPVSSRRHAWKHCRSSHLSNENLRSLERSVEERVWRSQGFSGAGPGVSIWNNGMQRAGSHKPWLKTVWGGYRGVQGFLVPRGNPQGVRSIKHPRMIHALLALPILSVWCFPDGNICLSMHDIQHWQYGLWQRNKQVCRHTGGKTQEFMMSSRRLIWKRQGQGRRGGYSGLH